MQIPSSILINKFKGCYKEYLFSLLMFKVTLLEHLGKKLCNETKDAQMLAKSKKGWVEIQRDPGSQWPQIWRMQAVFLLDPSKHVKDYLPQLLRECLITLKENFRLHHE